MPEDVKTHKRGDTMKVELPVTCVVDDTGGTMRFSFADTTIAAMDPATNEEVARASGCIGGDVEFSTNAYPHRIFRIKGEDLVQQLMKAVGDEQWKILDMEGDENV